MERKIDEFLKKWKNDLIRKPLVIYGSKQVGKTFSVLEFGKREYKNVVTLIQIIIQNLLIYLKRKRQLIKL